MKRKAHRVDSLRALKTIIGKPKTRDFLSSKGVRLAALLQHLRRLEAHNLIANNIESYVPAPPLKPAIKFPPPLVSRALDIPLFARDINCKLSQLPISGYALRVRKDGSTVHTHFSNWARRPHDPHERGWKPEIKMHVASVSKLLTGIAVTKLLHDKRMSPDSAVRPFLPAYFQPALSTASLTFRQLLTHTSGFRKSNQGGVNDGYTYTDFRFLYETGVSAADQETFNYHNGNYLGLRIAMAVLSGRMRPTDDFGWIDLGSVSLPLNDLVWDQLTTAHYVDYVTQNVLVPSLTRAGLTPGATDSLAYASDLSLPGWAANATVNAGTAGWWLSVDDVMNIMNTFWQSDAIVPRTVARKALREGFGLDDRQPWQTLLSRQDCFTKGGYWADASGKTQQCVVAFAPKNIEIAVFVNSPMPGNNLGTVVAESLRLALRTTVMPKHKPVLRARRKQSIG